MAKTVIKEIIIGLLLCLAIILILGILLYEYAPINKTVPTEVAYSIPEEVKEELMTSDDVDESKIIMTYEVDSTDLSNYQRIQDYKPGKSNPFSSYETQTVQGNAATGSSGTTSTSNGTTTNSNTSGETTSSTGTQTTTNGNTQESTNTSQGFYPDRGTK